MSWNFKSVAVIGSGAIGLYYGGRLAAAGGDVRFLLRSDYEALAQDGLRVESVHGDFSVKPFPGFRTVEEIGPVDLVIVAWKATANDLLADLLPPLLHPGTQVITLQNGLGNCEAIAEIAGAGRVLGGLCFVCSNRVGHGVVRHTAGGKVAVGAFAGGIDDGLERQRRVAPLQRLADHGQDVAVAQRDRGRKRAAERPLRQRRAPRHRALPVDFNLACRHVAHSVPDLRHTSARPVNGW